MLITSMGLKTLGRSKKDKKARYVITNVSIKDILNIIKEFEKVSCEVYVQKRPKYEPTDSYFYLARQIAKCMMRADALQSHIDPVRTEITGTQHINILRVFLWMRANQKGSSRTKTYRKYVLRSRANPKELSEMKVLRKRSNQKAFTEV